MSDQNRTEEHKMAKMYLTVDICVEMDDSYIPHMVDKAGNSLDWGIARKDLVLDILHEMDKPGQIIAKATIEDILCISAEEVEIA